MVLKIDTTLTATLVTLKPSASQVLIHSSRPPTPVLVSPVTLARHERHAP